MPTARRLYDLEITSVDVVAAGANMDEQTGEGSRLVLFKSAGHGDGREAATMSDKQQAGGASPPDERAGDMAVPDTGATDDVDQVDEVVEPAKTAKAKKVDPQPDVAEAVAAAVAKARAEADQQIAALKADITAASTALAEMKQERVDALFAEKAASFAEVGDVSVIAEVLKGAAASSNAAELLPKVEQMFQAAAARVAEGAKRGRGMFAELGTTATAKSAAVDGPAVELETVIAEIATAKGLTREAATVDAIRQRPELYGAFLDSQHG